MTSVLSVAGFSSVLYRQNLAKPLASAKKDIFDSFNILYYILYYCYNNFIITLYIIFIIKRKDFQSQVEWFQNKHTLEPAVKAVTVTELNLSYYIQLT